MGPILERHRTLRKDLNRQFMEQPHEPSGKFAMNALILELGALAHNVLRLMGQFGLDGCARRHPTRRRRIRAVIQERLYVAARVVRSGREAFLQFGKRCRVFDRLLALQARLCPA